MLNVFRAILSSDGSSERSPTLIASSLLQSLFVSIGSSSDDINLRTQLKRVDSIIQQEIESQVTELSTLQKFSFLLWKHFKVIEV